MCRRCSGYSFIHPAVLTAIKLALLLLQHECRFGVDCRLIVDQLAFLDGAKVV